MRKMSSKWSDIPYESQWSFDSLAQVFPPKQKPVPTKLLKSVVNSKSNCDWEHNYEQKAKSWRFVFTGVVNELERVNENTPNHPKY